MREILLICACIALSEFVTYPAKKLGEVYQMHCDINRAHTAANNSRYLVTTTQGTAEVEFD